MKNPALSIDMAGNFVSYFVSYGITRCCDFRIKPMFLKCENMTYDTLERIEKREFTRFLFGGGDGN